jgi:hypothetical protein
MRSPGAAPLSTQPEPFQEYLSRRSNCKSESLFMFDSFALNALCSMIIKGRNRFATRLGNARIPKSSGNL